MERCLVSGWPMEVFQSQPFIGAGLESEVPLVRGSPCIIATNLSRPHMLETDLQLQN